MGYSSAQAKEFIDHIAPMMVAEGKSRGYRIISTAIAQAIIEGAAGTSSLAKNYHNHFGLKCGSKWKGKSVNMKTKEEYTVGTLTTIKDNFRAYDNDVEGIKGYYDFISTSRYANLKTASTYKQYAQNLKYDGYATSSTYINTLCNTVVKYGLVKYDEITEVSYYPSYDGSAVQIDEIFRCIGVPDEYIGGWEKRKPVAYANGISNYTGSGKQNTLLCDLARSGQLKRV